MRQQIGRSSRHNSQLEIGVRFSQRINGAHHRAIAAAHDDRVNVAFNGFLNGGGGAFVRVSFKADERTSAFVESRAHLLDELFVVGAASRIENESDVGLLHDVM